MRKSTRINRLQKLHDFLVQLPPKKFAIKEWVTRFNQKNECGTVCCAIGWMPTVDKRNWEWDNITETPKLKGKGFNWTATHGNLYFGIGDTLFNHIFLRGRQIEHIKHVNLFTTSSPKKVAKNMALVIEALKNNELDTYINQA